MEEFVYLEIPTPGQPSNDHWKMNGAIDHP